MKMRSHEIIPTEEANRPSPCHPDRGSEGAPNFVIPTEGHRARAEGSMWSDTLSSAKPDRQDSKRFCPLHRFLDSAFGLARNDIFECHPDRGTERPEWRDLW